MHLHYGNEPGSALPPLKADNSVRLIAMSLKAKPLIALSKDLRGVSDIHASFRVVAAVLVQFTQHTRGRPLDEVSP